MLAFYLLTFGATQAFALTGTLTVPILLSIPVLFAVLFAPTRSRDYLAGKIASKFGLQFFLSVLFLTLATVSLLVQNSDSEADPRAFSHLASYFAVFLLFWAGIERYVKVFQIPVDHIIKWITVGALLISVFVIVEFAATNMFGLDIGNYIPRAVGNDYDARYVVGSMSYVRARGLTSESGHTALYLAMFLPFVYYYFARIDVSVRKLIWAIGVVIFALVLTFSPAALVDLGVACSAVLVVRQFAGITRPSKRFVGHRKVVHSLISLIGVLIAVQIIRGSAFSGLDGILNKLLFVNVGEGSRTQRWEAALELFKVSPYVGGGPGVVVIQNGTGSTSLYLEILAETGILGLSLFILIIAVSVFRLLALRSEIKWIYLFSLVVALCHYSVISDYWYPWLWLILALINFQKEREVSDAAIIGPIRDLPVAGAGAVR